MASLVVSLRLPHLLELAVPASASAGTRAARALTLAGAVQTLVAIRLPHAVWLGASHACVPAGDRPAADVQVGLERLREEIANRFGVRLACGLARTRLAADIAARLVAPSGLLHVLPGYERRVLAPVSLRWLDGVDARLLDRFVCHGFRTCGDLAQASDTTLAGLAGGAGIVLGRLARGDDPRELPPAAPLRAWTVEVPLDERRTAAPGSGAATPPQLEPSVRRALEAAWVAAARAGLAPAEARLSLWSADPSHSDGAARARCVPGPRGSGKPVVASLAQLSTILASAVWPAPPASRAFVVLVLQAAGANGAVAATRWPGTRAGGASG